jgi:peptide/nickel transport system substrate-binding protein
MTIRHPTTTRKDTRMRPSTTATNRREARRQSRRTIGTIAVAIALAGAACGDDSGGTTSTASPTSAGGSATTAGAATTGAATTATGSSAATTAASGATSEAPATSAGTTTEAPASSAAEGPAPDPQGVVKVGMAKGDIDSIDPNRWYAAITWGLANGLCTTLLRYDDKPGNDGVTIVPGLAEMPTVSADGTEYTFKLRPAKFANGDPVTPADIKYTFERMATPDVSTGSDGYLNIVGKDEYTSGAAPDIAGITTTADSVVFKLTEPDGSFPYKIALPTTCPVKQGAPKTPDADGTLMSQYATGPYVIDSYTPEESMKWVRNPNYDPALGDRGKAAEIDFEIGVDPAQAALKIKAGDMDLYTGNFPAADVATLSRDESVKDQVHSAARPALLTVFLNNTVAPFDNVKVRQAVNFAVNRNQIQRVWGGPSVGTPTDQILPPSVPEWRDYDAYPNEPDLEKAKALMTESGITLPVKTIIHTRNDVAGFVEACEVIQANLKEIGIDVEIVGTIGSEDQAADADPEQKTPSGIVTFSMDFPDGQAFLNLLLDPAKPEFGGSYARFNDQSFIPLYEEVAAKTGTERAQAYIDLDEKVMRDAAPWAPLLVPSRFDFVSSRLTGYVYSQAMDNVNYNTVGVTA